jgi:hypothetical protein
MAGFMVRVTIPLIKLPSRIHVPTAATARGHCHAIAHSAHTCDYDASALSGSLSDAFRGDWPFVVQNDANVAVGRGALDGDAVRLSPGRYTVRLPVAGVSLMIDDLVIAAAEGNCLVITGRDGDELLVEQLPICVNQAPEDVDAGHPDFSWLAEP